MEFTNYFSREEIFELVERDFPFIDRPKENLLYVVDHSDLLRRIISKNIRKITGSRLNEEDLYNFYDEFGTLSSEAVKWIFPSFIRLIFRDPLKYDYLAGAFVSYFENANFVDRNSAYCFQWLSQNQVETTCRMLDYISQETDYVVSVAIENVLNYGEM